ncbi:MAG: peptidoglycan-binding protein [Acidimicrobiales bacterium]
MRIRTATIAITAAAALTGGVASLAVPTGSVSAAPVSAVPAARTAPGMPKFGDTGPMVAALQTAIIKNGFTLRGGASGKFDARTLRVLKTFQKVVGLKVTGVVDSSTARVLKLTVDVPTTTAAPTTTASPVTTVAPTTTASPVTTAAPAPSAPAFAFTDSSLPVRGNRGDSVVVLQKAIAAAGITVRGGIDGIFGSGTTESLRTFQATKGLEQNGLLDAATARALGLLAPAAVQVAAAPATAVLTIDTLPRRGQRGAAVVAVQNALVAAGVTLKGGVDGVFGAATTISLRAYQTNNGLNPTGQADVATAVKLGLVNPPAVQIAVFPVQGPCNFTDTWHAPRGEGRLHLGVDIIAAEGNLIYAAVDGTITKVYTQATDKKAGNGVRLTMADGTYFFYGHLQRLADGITVGSVVKAGQVLGTNGKTGATNTPHLHFEVHPRGGEAVNPFAVVKAADGCHVTAPRPAP